jgi:hypothetical protein
MGAAAGLVSGAVVAADLVLAKQFSVRGHPGHYHLGNFLLLLLCQVWIIEFTFVPMNQVRPDRAIVAWVTNVSSGILAAFVLANLLAGYGVLHGVALQWLPFLFQTLVAICAVSFANGWFAAWKRPNRMVVTFGTIHTGFPAVSWALYAVYCIGLGSVILGLLELNGLAEGLTIGLGGVAALLGYGFALWFVPTERVEMPDATGEGCKPLE